VICFEKMNLQMTKKETQPFLPRDASLRALTGFLITLFSTMLFTCGCGWTSPDALPGTLVGAGFAWWGFLLHRGKWYGRISSILAVIFTTFILIKNICDAIYGHG